MSDSSPARRAREGRPLLPGEYDLNPGGVPSSPNASTSATSLCAAVLHALEESVDGSPSGQVKAASPIVNPGGRPADRWSLSVRSRDRRAYSESIVLETGSNAGRRRLFAKILLEHADLHELGLFGEVASREHAGLRAAAQMSGPADPVAVPQLLGFDADARLVLMEYIEGVTLERWLASARWLGTSRRCFGACAALVRVGRWLGRFQQATVETRDGVDRVNWWIGRCERLLGEVESRLEAIGTGCVRDWSRRVIERLDYLGWQLPARLPLVASHGDLGPWNVLVGDRRLAVVDFAAFHADLPTMDVANMVTYLEYLEASMSYRRHWLERFRQAFLRG